MTAARSRPLAAALLAVLLAAVCGCGSWDSKYDPSHFALNGPIVPADVVLPQQAVAGEVEDGLYIAGNTSFFCCLIAPHARVTLQKYGRSRHLCIGVYVPDASLFRRHPQALFISLDNDAQRVAFTRLTPGPDTECAAIPRKFWRKTGEIAASISAAIDYVPVASGGGSDKRDYALVLVSIFFE